MANVADWLKLVLFEGGPGQCVFPINNACNASCGFCGFSRDTLPKNDWKFAPLDKSLEAARILYRNGVHYLIVTGGEPMMHPSHLELIRGSTEAGMTVLLVTNGSLLNPQSCQALKDAGLSSIVISIDAHDAAAHEQNRGLPKVCERIKKANIELKRLGIQSTASVTMSRLIKDYRSMPVFLRELGFSAVTFSYPLTHLDSSFLGYKETSLVSFKAEELEKAFDSVDALRRDMHVVNPSTSIQDMKRLLKGEPQRFECLGGYKYFYMDWDFNVWRCHHWDKPMGSVFDFDTTPRVRDGCQKCMIDCMRDPSVLQHSAVAISDAIGHARKGELRAAASKLLDRRNALSVKEAVGQAGWILGI